MKCDDVRGLLPVLEEETGQLEADARLHLDSCPDCSAQLESYRQLGAAMSELSNEIIEPPVWLANRASQRVREQIRRREIVAGAARQLTSPKVLVGGAVLAAGVAAGAIVMRRRRRGFRAKLRHALA